MMKLSMVRLMPLTILVMMSLSVSATSSAADARGDEFITAMDGDSISGIGTNGLAFNLHFLAGGDVTCSSLGRANVHGTWRMNHDGDVCIKWPERVEAFEGCFQMSVDGDAIIWRNKSAGGHGKLRGSIVDSVHRP
jgi:hypothetical protein